MSEPERVHTLLKEKLARDRRANEEYGEVLLRILSPVFEAGIDEVTSGWGYQYKTPVTINFADIRVVEDISEAVRPLNDGRKCIDLKKALSLMLSWIERSELAEMIDESLALPYLGISGDKVSPETQGFVSTTTVFSRYNSTILARLGINQKSYNGEEVGFPEIFYVNHVYGEVKRGVPGVPAGRYDFITYQEKGEYWNGFTKE